jgi:hypothetical protein
MRDIPGSRVARSVRSARHPVADTLADALADADADARPHGNAGTHTDAGPDSHAHTYADPHGKAHRNAHADPGAVLQPVKHHHRLPDADARAYGYADTGADGDTPTDGTANADSAADGDTRADRDTDPRPDRDTGSHTQPLWNAARRSDGVSAAAVALTGLLYGVAAFALSLAIGDVRLALARRTQTLDAFRIKLMCVTLSSIAVGCFTATRGLTLPQTAATALIVAALAATISAPRTASRELLLAISTIPVGFVVFAAALDAMWPAVFSALFAALPFLVTAAFVADRNASFQDAAIAALAGVSIGITSAFLVLFVALLCALVWSRAGRGSIAPLRLAPYIAAFTLVGILLDMSVLT